MLYYLFDYLHRAYNLPGAGMFQYISFRAGLAAILSLLIATIFGKRIINLLYRLQVGETVRDLGQAQQYLYPTTYHLYYMDGNDRLCR